MKYFKGGSIGCLDIELIINEIIDKYGKDSLKGVFVDYLDILKSDKPQELFRIELSHITLGLKTIAVEYNVPLLTATQTTRSGHDNSDPELSDTSESFGLPATADLMFALIRSEQLDEMDQIMVKQLKNRYADPTSFKRFVLGVDRAKMKLFDVEDSAQQDIADSGHTDSGPVFDNSNIGKKIKHNDFNSFKF